MSLGFDVAEEQRTFVKEGMTGEVRRYTQEKMSYPCYILVNSEEKPVEMHKIKVLPSMFKTGEISGTTNLEVQGISIYYREGEKTIKLGKIMPRQVKGFLRLFDGNVIDGFVDAKTPISGDYLYVLSD